MAQEKYGSHKNWILVLCLIIIFVFLLMIWVTSTLSLYHPITKINIDSTNRNESIIEERIQSEILFQSGKGYLWLEHARKSDGTALCMILRWNMYGLIELNDEVQIPTDMKRATCQIQGYGDKSHKHFPKSLNIIMKQYNRNFIEMERCGFPSDILTNSFWRHWSFITSIRNPLDRIVSAIRILPPLCNNDQHCNLSTYINIESITNLCKQYQLCMSNYFTRMFLGIDNDNKRISDDVDINESHLLSAIKILDRISCIIIVEYWDETIKCLGQRLGLYRRDNVMRNYGEGQRIGSFLMNDAKLNSNLNHSKAKYILNKQDYSLLESLNKFDILLYQHVVDTYLNNG